ncbi:MAG: hypothetical protein Q4C72_08130 [Eubacteriales bacterium]|nr:hypothetical protein [Eubacteriales bacterium]
MSAPFLPAAFFSFPLSCAAQPAVFGAGRRNSTQKRGFAKQSLFFSTENFPRRSALLKRRSKAERSADSLFIQTDDKCGPDHLLLSLQGNLPCTRRVRAGIGKKLRLNL